MEHANKERGQLAARNADKSRVEEQIQPLVDEWNALKEQRQKSDKSLKRVQLELGQVKADKEHLKAELEQLKQENWRLATKRDSSDALRLELQRIRELLEQARAEVERLSKLQADTVRDKDILSYELGRQREECAALKSSLRLAEKNSEQLIERLRGQRRSLELELQSLQAKMAEQSGDVGCSKCVQQLEEIRKLQKLSKRQAKQAKHSDHAPEQQEDLVAELKSKVEQFKAYIKASECPTQSAQQCNEPLEQQQSNMFHAQLQQAEEKYKRLKSSYQKVCAELEKRQCEIQQLQQAAEKHQRVESSYEGVRGELEKQLQQAAENHQRVESSYEEMCAELEERLYDIQQMKHTIVEVRGKMTKVMAKNSELNALVSKCRHGEQCIDDLKRGFDEECTNPDSERQSMNQVLAQWEAQKGEIKQLKTHWQKKMSAVQHEHQQEVDSLNERHREAMQTIQNYKRHVERLLKYKGRDASAHRHPREQQQ
ncbi:blast:Polyamine-modulated factor 1-binding protein 1 [Drosophila guanche]|uniref:Blast:Polyamine-modulated factor 1-binding protein 1 n=1 Tax=Drosophila guanche TaxID=7266 RepID=A0A3B0J9Y3_DROGU|nr:blast:Polyamine-modulated factor 1-binding protein 1 [Drosophila guanche]